MAAKRKGKRTAPKQAAATEAVLAAVEPNVSEVAEVHAVATKARSSKRGRTDADQENAHDHSGTGVTEAAPAPAKGKGWHL
jgi:hypothetical protein